MNTASEGRGRTLEIVPGRQSPQALSFTACELTFDLGNMGEHQTENRRSKPSTPPGAWQFLFVGGKLVGPVKIGQTVPVYPDIDLEVER